MSTRTFGVGKRQVTLDLSHQRLHLDLPHAHTPFREIEPTPHPATTGLVSCAALAHKAKRFDEGLRAAVERLLQRGAGPTPGRRLLLALLADKLGKTRSLPSGDAVAVVFAACKLGAIEAHTPPSLQTAVDDLLTEFERSARRSQPLGLYAEHPDLARSFRQDRMLAKRLTDAASIRAVAACLHDDPRLAAMYRAHVSLNRDLAGAFKGKSLRHALAHFEGRPDRTIPSRASFFPPSLAVEDRVVRGDMSESGSLLQTLLEGVKEGTISLALPRFASWRDHQAWALDAVARLGKTPEARQLSWESPYAKHLDTLFLALMALTRETHIKNLDEEEECEGFESEDGEGELVVQPGLTVEPLPTHYARVAEGYRFVRTLLDERFGRAMAETQRLRSGAAVTVSLGDELRGMEALFAGAAETARDEVGIDGVAPSKQTVFHAWRKRRADDRDLAEDVRTMVPLSTTVDGERRVALVLGWSTTTLTVDYLEPPTVQGTRRVRFEGERHTVESPVVVETVVRAVMGRDDFRRLCDRHRSVGAITRALRSA